MNKLRYRIVFNKARGLQMVVAEHVRSGGKAASSVAPGTAALAPPSLRLCTLAAAVAVAFNLCAPMARAQIVADPGAPGGQRPTVLNTANGVIQVNIQTPSAAGVSRNTYKQFDVPNSGAVLNNSRTDTQTQLGGWVQGNPWLAQREAKVILNEVNSSNPSRLQGYIEVAGPRADVIIANPSGISVDGGGFINVSRATLTSGTARMTDGRLDGFTLARGKVSIDGAGLDASSTDYTAIIARSVAVNAALWAKQLHMTTGAGEVAIGGDSVQTGPGTAQGEAPNYAIDVSALGGMYANKIFLVGTEAGVGVRNAGAIGAAAGDLVVTSEGRLENSGRLASNETVQVDARGVENSGTLAGDAGVRVTAAALRNSGVIQSAAEAKLVVQGDLDNSGGTVRAQRVEMRSAQGAIVNRGGLIEQTGGAGLDVRTAALVNTAGGQIGDVAPTPATVAAGAAVLPSAPSADVSAGAPTGGTALASADTTSAMPTQVADGVIGSAQSLDNSGGHITAGGVISLAAGDIDNSGGKLYLRELAFGGVSFSNRGGAVDIARNFSVTARAFDNNGGAIQAGSATFDIDGVFDNAHGKVDSDSALTIKAGAVSDVGGMLSSQDALRVGSGATRTDGAVWTSGADVILRLGAFDHAGTIVAGRDLNLRADALTSRMGNLYAGANIAVVADVVANQHGTIQAGNALGMSVAGTLSNSGLLEARGTAATLLLDAGSVDNAGGRIVNGGVGATSVHSAGELANVGGVISARGTLALTGGAIDTAGAVLAQGELSIHATDRFHNMGEVSSAAALAIDGGAIVRNAGSIVAAGSTRIVAGTIDNDGGQLATAAGSAAALAMHSRVLSNRGGAVLSDGDLQVAVAETIDNSAGVLQAAGSIDAVVDGAVINRHGAIEALGGAATLTLRAGAVDNGTGRIVNAGKGAATVSVDGALASSGLIQAHGALDVSAQAVHLEAASQLVSGADLALAVREQLDNAGTIATANGSGARLDVTAHRVGNVGGAIRGDGAVTVTAVDALNNARGTIWSAAAVKIAAGGALDNQDGAIELASTDGVLAVDATNIDSRGGRIVNVGTGNTTISATGSIVNSGLIAGNGLLSVHASSSIDNENGTIRTGEALRLGAGSVNNTSGVIESATSMQLQTERIDNLGGRIVNAGLGDTTIASSLQFTNSGLIGGNGNLSLTADVFDNRTGGVVTAGKAMTLAVDRQLSNAGRIESGAGLIVSTGVFHNRSGTLMSNADAQIRAAHFDNAAGLVQSADALALEIAGSLNNEAGTIETRSSSGTMTVRAGSILNGNGRIASAADAILLSNGRLQSGGLIQAARVLDMSAQTVEVTGTGKLVSGGAMRVGAAAQFDNAGEIGSQGALAIEAGNATVTNSGHVVSNGSLEVSAARLNNGGGQIATAPGAGADVTLRAGSISNVGGTLTADGAAHIASTGTFNNNGGNVQAARALDIHAAGLTNAGGGIANIGSGATTIESTATLFNSGLIAGNGDLLIGANTLVNEAAGKISAVGALDLAVTTGLQNAGAITSSGALTFQQAAAALDNRGMIAAGGAVAMAMAALQNDGGNIASDTAMTLRAEALSNHAGNIVALGDADIAIAGAVDNSSGALRTAGDLHLNVGAALNNNTGAIESVGEHGALSIHAGSIDNLAGRIVNGGAGATSVATSSGFVNSGMVAGNGDLAVAAATLENRAGGAITAGNALTLSTASQLHNAGSIASRGTFDVQASGASVINSGQLLAGGRAALAAGAFNNDGGQIATAGGSAADLTLHADSFSNRNGSVLSDRDASITLLLDLNNRSGTIQAANALRVSAGGALNNYSGIIEDGGASAAMSVAAQSIDNTLGRIVNAGTGLTDIRSVAGFENSGMIAGGGALALAGASLQNRTGGTISSGADLALAFYQQFANLGGAVSSGGTLAFNQAGAAFRNSGAIVAQSGIGIVAGAIDNTGGQVVTVRNGGGNVSLRGDSLENRGGVVLADGSLDLAIAGTVDNTGGMVQAAHDTQVTAGAALLNDGGTIEAAGPSGNLTVRAGAIDNGTGRINNAGTGATAIASQGRLSNNGLVAGSGNLIVEAATLQNGLAGTIGATGNVDLAVRDQVDNAGTFSSVGALRFNQAGAVFNNSGTTVSGAATSIIAAAVNNHGQMATVRGAGGDLLISGALDNSNGMLLADGNATLLLNGTLNNTSGTVQAVRDLWLSTNGAIANQGGSIETVSAASALTLHAGAIDNTGGHIVNIGNGDTRLSAVGGITNGGAIGGNGNVVLAGQTLANLAGATISSGANLDLAITRGLENQGVINSAGTLIFNQAGAVFRNSNVISAGNTISIAAGEFNNEGGKISTGADSGASITLQAQTVNNAGGHIVSDRDMSLTAGLLLGGGEFASGRDLAVSLQGDFINNTGAAQLRAQRDLSLAVTGSLQNTATLEAVRALTLSANQVDNLAGGTIQAQAVTVRSAGDIENAGEINGATTLDLHAAGALNNHAGIVGGDVTLAAQNVNNTGSLALLGATDGMTLNVGNTINNTGNATIFSAAGLAASADTLNNLGSTVEAGGDMGLVINTINNIRENVSTVQVTTLDETRHMTLPSWYTHGDNNNEYDPKSALYRPKESYFINPADILEQTEVVTPDGETVYRVTFRTHATDSAFFAAGSGAYGKYGHRERIAMSDGTRTMYFLERVENMVNPDQGGASGNGNPLFDSTTMVWDGPAVSFSSNYGSCSTNCVRFVTQPGYDDPVHTIILDKVRELAPSKDRLEIYRDAHYAAVEDRLADGAGTLARIVAGGDMQLITGRLHNQYGQVMANGFLDLTRAAAVVNEGATLYRRYNFDGTWTTENHTVTAYTMPTVSEAIGTTKGVISGGLGVIINAGNFSNIDVTAGTAGIVRDAIHVVGSGTSNGSTAAVVNTPATSDNAAGLSGSASGTIGQAAATYGLVNTHWIASTGGAEQVHGNNGSIVTTAGTNSSTDAGPRSALSNGSLGPVGAPGNIHGVAEGTNSGGASGTRANQIRTSETAAGGAVLAFDGKDTSAGKTEQQGSVMKVAPSGLFTQNPVANGKYLFETRPQFANQKDWASSDYLFAALGMDGSLMQKRLGDGFYEQRLVREQIAELTGRGTSNGISDDTRYQELLSNAVTVAKQFGLRPGIALTAEQVSRLTSDIVWMESQSVSLPDGSIESVLVPKVYLAHLDQNTIRGGALVTGANVYINTQEDIVNRGGVIDSGTGRTILISGRDILNEGGTIRGGDVLAAAARDVRNESTSAMQVYGSAQTSGSYTVLASQAAIAASGTLAIQAGRDVSDVAGKISAANASIVAGRDISFNALTTGSTYRATVGQDKQDNSTIGHALSQIATTGTLGMSAGRDLSLSGTQMSIGTDGILQAGRALTVGSVMNQVKTDEHNDASSKHYEKRAQDNQTVVGSSIGAGGALQLTAGINETAALTISSSAVSSTGALSLGASGDVVIGGVQERHVLDNASHHASSSMFSKSSNSSSDYVASNTLVGSSVNGKSVSVRAGNDLTITGSAVTAQDALTLVAGRDLIVSSGQQVVDESHSFESKKSGFSLKPSQGFGYSSSEQKQNGATHSTTQLGSVLSGGTVTALAGRDLSVSASTVVADGDISLAAVRNVSIVSAQDLMDSQSASSSKRSGSIGSLWQPAVGSVKVTEQGSRHSVSQVGSKVVSLGGNVNIHAGEQYTQTASDVLSPVGSIKIFAKNALINSGYDTTDSNSHSTYSKFSIGGNVSLPIVSTVQGLGNLASAAKDAGSGRMKALALVTGGMQVADAVKGVTASGTPAGIKIGLSIGSAKSESTIAQSSNTAVGSHIKAGGDVTIVATGGGLASNITAIGSDIAAGSKVTLVADNKIDLLAAENKTSQHSTNSSSGASIGVGYSLGGAQNGWSLEFAANRGSGNADGETLSHTNTHVSAGNAVVLQSGGDVSLRGAVISASNVIADIGGNLNIQSLQDSSKYTSKQSSAGIGLSICLPPACYGASSLSGSMGKSAANGDYLSVGEQSGIKTGDGGFQLVVHGNTDLVGGVISSSQIAIDQGRNSFATGSLTYSDLKNKDVYDASSFLMSASVSGKFGGQASAISDAQKAAASATALPSASAGVGRESGGKSNVTNSGISAGTLSITDAAKQAATGETVLQALAGVATGVTTDTSAIQTSALQQSWDGELLMKQVQAQTQITQAFSAQMPRQIAEYAAKQQAAITAKLKNDPSNPDLQSELAKWDEGGAYRVALHALSGAAGGGISGAIGAASVASAAPLLNNLQTRSEIALIGAGMAPVTAKTIAQGLAGATSLAVGSILGGTGAAAAALTTDTNNRQESIAEISLIRRLAEDKARQFCAGRSDCVTKMTLIWADALERVSKGLVDTTEDKKNLAYITALANASTDPNSDGARGGLQGYLNILGTAQAMLVPYSGQAITIRGQGALVNGSLLTYFSATQAQREDPYANESLGGVPDPVFEGVKNRDNTRVESFAAQNGSATAVYPVEEFVLGGAVMNRIGGSLARYLASLDVSSAITTTARAGGSASSQQLEAATKILQGQIGAQSSIVDKMTLGQLNNFYREGMSPSMMEQTFKQAAISSTHNAEAREVILGKYIPGSSSSYDAVAQARGATYFSMKDWEAVAGQLGEQQMWNINKSFLDVQISQGKSFIFTGNPQASTAGYFTRQEFLHLSNNGYVLIPDGGFFRAIKK